MQVKKENSGCLEIVKLFTLHSLKKEERREAEL